MFKPVLGDGNLYAHGFSVSAFPMPSNPFNRSRVTPILNAQHFVPHEISLPTVGVESKGPKIEEKKKRKSWSNISIGKVSEDPIEAQKGREETKRILDEMLGSAQSESDSNEESTPVSGTSMEQSNANNTYLFIRSIFETFMNPIGIHNSEEIAFAHLRVCLTDLYTNPKMKDIRIEIGLNKQYSMIINEIHEFVTAMGTDKFENKTRVSRINIILDKIKKAVDDS